MNTADKPPEDVAQELEVPERLPEEINPVGSIGKGLGLEWGGDFSSFVDKPHFQLATELQLADIRNNFEQGKAFV